MTVRLPGFRIPEPDLYAKKPFSAEQPAMRERSGEVDSNDPLVAFLYVLMRDHLTPGNVEQIMLGHVTGNESQFTNGWLATYAADVAARLMTFDDRLPHPADHCPHELEADCPYHQAYPSAARTLCPVCYGPVARSELVIKEGGHASKTYWPCDHAIHWVFPTGRVDMSAP